LDQPRESTELPSPAPAPQQAEPARSPGNAGADPSRLNRSDAVTDPFVAGDPARVAIRIARVGGVLILIFNVAAAVYDLRAPGPRSWGALRVDLLNATLGMTLFALSFTHSFLRYWRPLVLAVCGVLLSGNQLGVHTVSFEGSFVGTLLTMFGAAVLAPWSPIWQAALGAAGLLTFGLTLWQHPGADPDVWLHCLGLVMGFAGAQAGVILQGRLRAALSRNLGALEASRDHLHAAMGLQEATYRKLAQSESTLRKVFEASPDLLAISRLSDGRFMEVNESFLRAGFTRGQLASQPIGAIAPFSRDSLRAVEKALRRDGFVRDVEMRVAQPGGERIWLVSASLAEIDGETCIVSSSRDITVLKLAEQELLGAREDLKARVKALAESETKFRRVFDSCLDAISISRLSDRTYRDVNQAFLNYGYARETLLARPEYELELWPNRAQYDDFIATLARDGQVNSMAIDRRKRGGAIVPTLLSAVVVEIEGERCAVAVERDISKLKAAEDQLRYNQAVLRKTFDSVLDPLSVNDFPDGRYLYVNDEFLRAIGYAREQVIGKTFHDLGIFLEADQEHQFLDQLRTRGELRNMEATFRTKAGAAIPVLLSSSVLDLGGERRILSIARDITALKQAQRELEHAREAALEASRSKSAFLSSMSHEIRTPMNTVLGMADMLSETSLDADQHRYLDRIVSNGNALLELINGILDLARVESGRLSLESVAFDVVDLTGKVADTLAARAHGKGLELMVRFAPDLPRALIGDPLRLQQVLTNLIGNAIKFTEQGEVLVSVTRDPSDSAAGAILFAIADSGIGITGDQLGGIFAAFTQADSSTTRKYGGSGLGLSIVERLVTLMGGRVWAESEPGKGSTFRFTARFNTADLSQATTAPVANEIAGRRVLVVDDNATNRTIVREMLAQTGAVVTEADSGRAGLEAIEHAHQTGAPFDLILADDHMPSMDGIEMVKRARPDSPASRVIVILTADELNSALARTRQAGIGHYLVKPVKPDELYAALAQTMADHASPSPDHVQAGVDSNRAAQPRPQILGRELRILLADDSPDNRMLVRAYLKQTPYQLEEAENGAIAFGKYTAGSFDLVLMDIQMPVLDGYAAVRRIRAWEQDHGAPHTPVIALTASALDDDVRRAAEAGCDRHLSKPVKKATLLEAIAQAVNLAPARSSERSSEI
jgi:two-component system, sensor histidine kinase and response regulator